MESVPKSYRWLFLQAWLLLGAAAVFAVSVQSLALPVVSVLLLAASFYRRQPLPQTARAWIWTLVGCVGLCLLFASPDPSELVRFALMPSNRLCPILLGVGMAMTFFEQRAASLGAQATCALIAVILAGGNDAAGADLGAIRRLQAGLMLAMLFPLCGLVQRASVGVSSGAGVGRARWRFILGRLPGLVVAILLAAGLFAGSQLYLFSWSDAVSNFFSEWSRDRAMQQVGRQSPTADLRKSPSAKPSGDPVILRLWAGAAPGYLRVTAYPTYERGVWRALRATRPLSEADSPPELAPRLRFVRPAGTTQENGAERESWRIQPTYHFGGDYLPLPGAADQIDIAAENLRCDRDGSVRAEGWVRASGLRVQLPARGSRVAYGRLLVDTGEDAATNMDLYLAVPAGVVTGLLQRLEAWQVPPAGAPAEAIMAAVKMGLRSNLTYRLGVALDPDRDPVLQFLEGGQGHCELFAAAATLMLRQRGVRARYVSGYVCEERHASRRYWVARGSAAHAWVEAYSPERDCWLLVEATPSNGLPNGKDQFSNWGRHLDPLLSAIQQAWGAIRSGAALQGVRQGVVNGLLWFGEHVVATVTAVALLVGAWSGWRFLRVWRTTPARRRRLDTRRRRIDRRLAAAGHPRAPQTTLRAAVDAAAQLPVPEREALLADVAGWECERYGEQKGREG